LQDIGREVAALACSGTLVLEAAPTRRRREITLIDPDSGADKPVSVEWDDALQLQPLATRARPCGYWLAGEREAHAWRGCTRSASRCAPAGGGPAARRALPRDGACRGATWMEGPGWASSDPAGHGGARAQWLDVAPGSFYVPLDQPLAHLITAALEPDTAHSWYAHGLLPRLGR
jgi:hypothetical protein